MTAAMTTEMDQCYEQLISDLRTGPHTQRFTEAQLETLYSAGHGNFMQGKFAQALPYFSLLTIYAPACHRYLIAHGLCLQKLQRFEEALEVFSLAGILQPGAADAAVYSAECQLALGDKVGAEKTLRLVIAYAAEVPSLAEWQETAQAILTFINAD